MSTIQPFGLRYVIPHNLSLRRTRISTLLKKDGHQGSLARCATNDFTFSNGLKVPKGTFVFAPNAPVLFDERNYSNPYEFDGYRFYRLGQKTGKPQDFRFVATNSKYLQFGDGRHTW